MKKKWIAAISAAAVLVLVFAAALPSIVVADTKPYRYVSIGASNVNGYGLHGYLDEELYEAPWNLSDDNISGYGRAPEGSYPDLIRKELEKTHSEGVELTQLAMSSIRAEELHMLLDESYAGDAFTEWRFTDGQKWFDRVGGLDTLRGQYRAAISNADLITVDIGVNNFGVYVANHLFNGMYDTDVADVFDEKTLEVYDRVFDEIRAKVAEYISDYLGETIGALLSDVVTDAVKEIADTYAYALVGFCNNFDASIEKILEMKKDDSKIVVLSIQNVIDGLKLDVAGYTIPVGDLQKYVINMANVYMASVSPYHNRYLCADVRKDGCVTSFIDDFKAYNGDADTITRNVKDCFDVYQMSLALKNNIRYLFLTRVCGISMTKAEYQYAATHNDVKVVAGLSLPEFFALGEAGQLLGAYQEYYDLYDAILTDSYDGMVRVMQKAVANDTMELSLSILTEDSSDIEEYLMMAVSKFVEKNAILSLCTEDPTKIPTYGAQLQMANGQTYSVDAAIDGILKGDLTAFLTADECAGFLAATDEATMRIKSLFYYDGTCMVDEGYIRTIANMGVRIFISNGFCSHPNEQGHREIADAVLKTLKNKTTGMSIVIKELWTEAIKNYKKLCVWYGEQIGYGECIYEQATFPKIANLKLSFNGEVAGNYDIGVRGFGWTIRNDDGLYLGKDGTFGNTPYAWTWDGSHFLYTEVTKSNNRYFLSYKTTYHYLNYNGTDFTVTEAKPTVKLIETVTGCHFYTYADNGDGTHTATCAHCGQTKEPEAHNFSNHGKCACGLQNNTLDIKVKVTSSTTGKGFFKYPTYTANITVDNAPEGAKIEYSTSGYTWKKGTTLTSNYAIRLLYVRVTAADGTVTEYTYNG